MKFKMYQGTQLYLLQLYRMYCAQSSIMLTIVESRNKCRKRLPLDSDYCSISFTPPTPHACAILQNITSSSSVVMSHANLPMVNSDNNSPFSGDSNCTNEDRAGFKKLLFDNSEEPEKKSSGTSINCAINTCKNCSKNCGGMLSWLGTARPLIPSSQRHNMSTNFFHCSKPSAD